MNVEAMMERELLIDLADLDLKFDSGRGHFANTTARLVLPGTSRHATVDKYTARPPPHVRVEQIAHPSLWRGLQ